MRQRNTVSDAGNILARDSLVIAEPNCIFVVIQVRNQTVAMLHCAYQPSSMFSD